MAGVAVSEQTSVVGRAAVERASVPIPAAGASTLQRRAFTVADDARRRLMHVVPQVQYQLQRLGAAGLGGIAALFAAAIVALSLWLPAHQSAAVLSSELAAPGSLRDA